MTFASITWIAVALSMDAFAVAVASGFTIKKMRVHHALRMALFFGGFQAIMPIIGWTAGRTISGYISGFDHWIAFGLLSIAGAKMIYESFKLKEERTIDPRKLTILFALAIATSIDALAVGVSLSFLDVNVVEPAIIIGVITFLFSFAGVYIGKKFGHVFESKIEILGGVILIAIGVKILVEHLRG